MLLEKLGFSEKQSKTITWKIVTFKRLNTTKIWTWTKMNDLRSYATCKIKNNSSKIKQIGICFWAINCKNALMNQPNEEQNSTARWTRTHSCTHTSVEMAQYFKSSWMTKINVVLQNCPTTGTPKAIFQSLTTATFIHKNSLVRSCLTTWFNSWEATKRQMKCSQRKLTNKTPLMNDNEVYSHLQTPWGQIWSNRKTHHQSYLTTLLLNDPQSFPNDVRIKHRKQT